MLLVYTACPLIRNVIAACHEQGGLIFGTLSGKVIFGQEVVGGRKKVVGLDWVELDEGLMAWQRVLQLMMRTITWETKL